MALDLIAPTGLYSQQSSTLDFWIRDLTPGAPIIDAAAFEILENATIGTIVGTVTATDPNGEAFTWSIIGGNVGSAFAIDADTGEITTAGLLDFETRPSYSLTIAATDIFEFTGTRIIPIAVLDFPEPQPPPNRILTSGVPWAVAAASLMADLRARWSGALSLNVETRLQWQQLRDQDALLRLAFISDLPHRDIRTDARWRDLDAADRGHALPWTSPPERDQSAVLPWRALQQPTDRSFDLPWLSPPERDRPYDLPFQSVELHPIYGDWRQEPIRVLPGVDIDVHFRLGLNFNIPAGTYSQQTIALDFTVVEPEPVEPLPPVKLYWAPPRPAFRLPMPLYGLNRIPWAAPQPGDRIFGVRWGKGQPTQPSVGTPWEAEPNPPGPPPTYPTFPLQGVYTVKNEIEVVRLPERTPIHVLGGQLVGQLDSTAWTISLTLGGQQALDLLRPSSAGRKEVEVSINGFVLRGLIDDYGLDKSFGATAWVVGGRSRSAQLLAPDAIARSYTNSGLTNAAQLADEELAGTGWSVTWEAQDWAIAAGQFSYADLTPLEAISKLASAVGAVVQCHPSLKTLRVVSRYPVSPWAWAAETPDVELLPDVCITLGERYRPGVAYNAVYVTGGNQGVNVNATMHDTAGDVPLPTVMDPLIVHVDAGTERARVELARTGPRIDQAIVLPVMDPVGVVLPGMLVQVPEAVSWKGLATQTSITFQTGQTLEVQQQLVVERLPAEEA